jgi:hypothetical protein
MGKFRLFLALLAFAALFFYSCDGGNNPYLGDSSNSTGGPDPIPPVSSSVGGNNPPPSGISSSGTGPAVGISSSSNNNPAVVVSSSSRAASSSSTPATTGGCGYQASWCGGIASGDVIKTNQTVNNGINGPGCMYATAISKLGNGSFKVNGATIASGNGQCGNTDWGQQACTAALASIAKADGGYYVYFPSWASDIATTGGTPSCNGGTPTTSSSSTGGITPPGSSSSPATTYTLACASVAATKTAGDQMSAPAVTCNGSTVPGTSITWSGTPSVPNWTGLAQGSYSNIKAKATSGNCNGKEATCAGTLTVNPRPTQSSSSQGSGTCPTLPTLGSNDKQYRTTRYWDSCKPSCAWTANASGSPNGAAKSCNISGGMLTDVNTRNACDNNPTGTAYTCMDQAPWSACANVSYAFAASHSNGDCGKCFQLQFRDNGEGGGGDGLTGKNLIIMVSNIGGDVGGNQFDLMIPGGGVGQFNALSNQISQLGGSNSDLGSQYGGFRDKCKNDVACVQRMCNAAFSDSRLSNLKAGCQWYVDWLKIANNPNVYAREMTCPDALKAKYR